METSSPTYRLERWIAFFLFLLFFLPFVARGEDLLLTGTFHQDEVTHASSDDWLALVSTPRGWMLQPVGVVIERDHDPIVDLEGEMTGKRVTAIAVDEPLLLVRGRRLGPGAVTPAMPDAADLRLQEPATLRLGGVASTLRYRCNEKVEDEYGFFPCALQLVTGTSVQTLATYSSMRDEHNNLLLAGSASPTVLWAGDLDHDGRLDLVIDTSWHYNLYAPSLYLSSAAAPGQLVAKVATFSSAGC